MPLERNFLRWWTQSATKLHLKVAWWIKVSEEESRCGRTVVPVCHHKVQEPKGTWTHGWERGIKDALGSLFSSTVKMREWMLRLWKKMFFFFLFMGAGIIGGSLLAYSWLGGMGKISTLLLWKRSHGSSKRYTWMGPTPSLRPWAKIIEIVTSSRSTLDSEHEGLPSICLNWLRFFICFPLNK